MYLRSAAVIKPSSIDLAMAPSYQGSVVAIGTSSKRKSIVTNSSNFTLPSGLAFPSNPLMITGLDSPLYSLREANQIAEAYQADAGTSLKSILDTCRVSRLTSE